MKPSLQGLALLAVLPFVCVSLAAGQRRVKPKGMPQDFKTLHTELGADFAGKRYSASLEKAQALVSVIAKALEQALLDVMPDAPAGHEKVPQKKEEMNPNNPMAKMAAGMAALGNVTEQRYRKAGTRGRGDVVVSVTANSPALHLLSMTLDNPALLAPGDELIEYDQAKGVLKKDGSLMVRIGEDIIECRAPNREKDFSLTLINQETVNRFETVLKR